MHAEVIREVERFLYREARLLDERRFHAWLDLFTDDVRYWMPVRSTRYPKVSKAIVILDPDRYVEVIFFLVTAYTGEISNRVFEAVEWAPRNKLPEYNFLEADRGLVGRLARGEIV